MSKKKDVELTADEIQEEVVYEVEIGLPEGDKTEPAKLDWKLAAEKLKKLVEDQSIDTFFRKDEINKLRDRYNNKERSEELFNQIMGV